ncbi:hypothetical protein H6F32_00725 [Anabaena sp. FACHB-1237]|uniref:hypothetical protein n=1 Tax=Anabaena sp. FACHB-1237 TaxID=2692769 RepID=UPI001680C5F6|nr:hypothetical protein [Anabaena sp. FACHB-1237]MBD2136135.1 hypothetical protein [Anabaena sp. FACHB-1237]
MDSLTNQYRQIIKKNLEEYADLFGKAEKKLASLQAEYLELQESIKNIEILKSESSLRKQELDLETIKIEEDIEQITTENKNLKSQLEELNQSNQNLTKVNLQLEKENEELKLLENQLFLLHKEYKELKESIEHIEILKSASTLRKQELEQETRKLEEDIQRISKENKNLQTQVDTLSYNNQQLTEANSKLKKDNRDLKNILDQIKLKLTIHINSLLRLEDSEIRKGLIKLLQSIQG